MQTSLAIPQMIPGRYSDLLLVDLYTSEQNLGLSPEHIAQEIALRISGLSGQRFRYHSDKCSGVVRTS